MVEGDVPVVSGGLQPAGYHNVANTRAPVITISASGANAGFVRFWATDVWSADSSYIDQTITEHVYFYYLLLLLNQRIIYDMQTGAAQPHIYPSHLERLEIPNAPVPTIDGFNNQVAPLFTQINVNTIEIHKLTEIRDRLLSRLMSGQIHI